MSGGDVFTGSEKPLSCKHNIFTTVKGCKLALYNLQFKLKCVQVADTIPMQTHRGEITNDGRLQTSSVSRFPLLQVICTELFSLKKMLRCFRQTAVTVNVRIILVLVIRVGKLEEYV